MRKIASLFVLTLIISASAFAGKDSTKTKKERDFKRHEVLFGINNPFNNSNNNYTNNYVYWDYYYGYYGYYPYGNPYGYNSGIDQNSPQFGIGYKYHMEKSSIRFLVNGNKKSDSGTVDYNQFNSGSNGIDNSISAYDYSTADIRLGYERNVNVNSFQFYFGVDAFYNLSNYTYTNSYDNTYETTDWINNEWVDVTYTDLYDNSYETKYSAFGGSPVIGLKYHFNEFLSISTETRIDVSFYTSTTISKYSVDYGNVLNPNYSYETTTVNKGNNISVSPFKLISINAHL
ncbi:MAG: hypothetical protein JKY53_09400 [Flavobacteriales bacterium]|nr:hypothetical protein [Flavobacteriales bacterium]